MKRNNGGVRKTYAAIWPLPARVELQVSRHSQLSTQDDYEAWQAFLFSAFSAMDSRSFSERQGVR